MAQTPRPARCSETVVTLSKRGREFLQASDAQALIP